MIRSLCFTVLWPLAGFAGLQLGLWLCLVSL